MSKIENGGLDQYCTKPFEQWQCGTSGLKGLKTFQGQWQAVDS